MWMLGTTHITTKPKPTASEKFSASFIMKSETTCLHYEGVATCLLRPPYTHVLTHQSQFFTHAPVGFEILTAVGMKSTTLF